ncbi:heme-binding protein [Maritimibacter sp. DP1N21-5]|uniref:GlcG/HbpS family heme-binding protein n=1 Tax=Maritimibacter sp. DP1N21-5 TaxID=2836867 RepID=UPI001C471DDF|nr:heme-binding protein [Maritimibacter sp. DP1N21-5]MBV7409404.1 heme-binding protein [Maritimibacter sp. DP1N21-5]
MAGISLRRARTIIRKTMDHGREAGWKPLSVVVVDAGGHVIAFERSDGAPPGRFDIALGKARGCVLMGMTGTQLRDRAETQAYFVTSAGAALGQHLVPVPGGILVRDAKGTILGAVGVTGDTSENDLAAGAAAIEAAGLVSDG